MGQTDPLEKEMETHSSILAWEIPWPEEPGKLLNGSHGGHIVNDHIVNGGHKKLDRT